ncbi:MAG: saccharopine dehydrogenase [Candidatus Nanopelagicales bacterium]
MTEQTWIWLRAEDRATEQRAPLVPADAAKLVAAGVRLTVEESPNRVFPSAEYVAAGAAIAPAGSWHQAPAEVYILGIKELPPDPDTLSHRHIYFGHAYKGQQGAPTLLARFAAGGGQLLDIEYLVDEHGRRRVAFGYWAGYVGAALGVLALRGNLQTPLAPLRRAELDAALRQPSRTAARLDHALVIGAAGRSGTGARDALACAGVPTTGWRLADTRALDRAALLANDLLVNAVLVTAAQEPFLTWEDTATPARRLAMISDVTCDVTSELNVLPINTAITTWQQPVRRLVDSAGGNPPLDVIAIDNLPSLVPFEASVAFSADLLPLLLELGPDAAAWQRAADRFATAVAAHPGDFQ